MAGSEHLTTQIDQITAPLIELCDSSDNLLRIAVASRIIQTAIPFAPVQDRNKLERIAYQCDGRVKKTAGRYEVVIGDLGRWIDQYEDNSDIRFKTRLVRRVLEAALGVLPENSKLCSRLTNIVAGYPELGAKEHNKIPAPREPAPAAVTFRAVTFKDVLKGVLAEDCHLVGDEFYRALESASQMLLTRAVVKEQLDVLHPSQRDNFIVKNPAVLTKVLRKILVSNPKLKRDETPAVQSAVSIPKPEPVLEEMVAARVAAARHESLHRYMKRFIAQNEALEGQKLINRAISVAAIIKRNPKQNKFVVSEKVVRNSHHVVINPDGLEQYLKQILYAPKPEHKQLPRPPSFFSTVNKVYDSEKQRGTNLKNCALTYYTKLKKDPKIKRHLGTFKQGFSYLFAKNPAAVEAELLHYFREVVPAAENKPAAPEPQEPAPKEQEQPSLISIIRKAHFEETQRGAKPARCPETYLKLMKDMHKITRHLGTGKKGRFPCLVAKNPSAVEAAVLKYFQVEASDSEYSDNLKSLLAAKQEKQKKKEQFHFGLVKDVVSDELGVEGRTLRFKAAYLWHKFSTDAVVSQCVRREEGQKQYTVLRPKALERRLRILLRREKKPKESPSDIIGIIVAKPENLSGEKLEKRKEYLWQRFCSDGVVNSCVARKRSGNKKYYEFINRAKLKQRLHELWKSLSTKQSGISVMRKVVSLEEGLAGARLLPRANHYWHLFKKNPEVRAYIPGAPSGRYDAVSDPHGLKRCLTRHLIAHKAKIAAPSLTSLLRTIVSKKANTSGLASLKSRVNLIMPYVKSDSEARKCFDEQGSGLYKQYTVTNPARLEERMSQIVDDYTAGKFLGGKHAAISTYSGMVKDAIMVRVKDDESITPVDIDDEARYLSMRFRKDKIVKRLIKKGGKNGVSIAKDPEKLKARIDVLVDEYRRHVSPLCRDDVSTAIQFEVSVKPLGNKVTYKNIVRLAISQETGITSSELENDVLRFIRKHNDDAVLTNLTVFYEMNRKSNVAKLDEYVRELVAKDYDASDRSAEQGVRAAAKGAGLYDFASGIALSLFESEDSEINYLIEDCIGQWAKQDDVRKYLQKGKVEEPAKLRHVLTDLIMAEQAKLDPCAPKRSEFEGKYFSLNEIRHAIGVNDVHQFKNYLYLLGEPMSVKGHTDSPAAYKGINTYHFVMAVRADMMRKGALKPLSQAASE